MRRQLILTGTVCLPSHGARTSSGGYSARCPCTAAVAALHQGEPSQMTCVEEPPPWLPPCLSNSENRKNVNISQISDCFTCFILTMNQSAATLSFSRV